MGSLLGTRRSGVLAIHRRPERLYMSYVLQTDSNTGEGLRRIAVEQIERAIAVFDDKQLQQDEAVHRARQRCKKIRALLHLLGEANSAVTDFENSQMRDAAAGLAQVRNADALLDTYDDFRKCATEGVSCRVLKRVRQVLLERRELTVGEDSQVEIRIEGFRADMCAALERASSWAIELDGAAHLLLGFERSHRHGRRAMKSCRRAPSNERYHEWRKWSKYQLYQTRLLKHYLTDSLKQRVRGLIRIGELLGIDHDLAVLRHELVEASDFSSVRDLTGVGGLPEAIDEQRRHLQKQSLKLGKRMYTIGIEKRIRFAS
ncbi:MAG: CHAD domain-containing protein [Planctomycetales bacterium]|nr:CHAD domain-containing protein [Planctomycetales bacterium]